MTANIHTAPILVDSNILLDVISSDPQWGEWSRSRLSEATEYSSLAINPVIYAEVSVGIARIEEMEELLPRDYFRRLPLPWEAAFLAGKAFLRYRRNSGIHTHGSAPAHGSSPTSMPASRRPCGVLW